jgi:glucan biosynthesis protein C
MRIPSAPQPRYHFVDTTRAAMMLLGVALHARLSFTGAKRDDDLTGAADSFSQLAYYFIHLFRMPVFFLIAGFCAALIYQRRGAAEFVRNRFARVAVPLVVAWLAFAPWIKAGHDFINGERSWNGLYVSLFACEWLVDNPRLSYLWFLEYLAIYCALAPVLLRIASGFSTARRDVFRKYFARVLDSQFAPYCFAVTTIAMLFSQNRVSLEHSMTVIPNWRPLVGFWVFFLVGWAVYERPRPFELLQKHWKRHGMAAVVVTSAYLYFLAHPVFKSDQRQLILSAPLAGVASWLMVYTIVGAAAQFVNKPNGVVRYVSDAAYWVYLVHFPLIIWTIALAAPFALAPGALFALVLTVAIAVPLVSYHYFVRNARLGELLNGKRAVREPVTVESEIETESEPVADVLAPALKLFDPAELGVPARARPIPARRAA